MRHKIRFFRAMSHKSKIYPISYDIGSSKPLVLPGKKSKCRMKSGKSIPYATFTFLPQKCRTADVSAIRHFIISFNTYLQFLFFFLSLVCFDNLLSQLSRYFLVLIELHSEGASALGHRSEADSVVKKFCLRSLCQKLLSAVS